MNETRRGRISEGFRDLDGLIDSHGRGRIGVHQFIQSLAEDCKTDFIELVQGAFRREFHDNRVNFVLVSQNVRHFGKLGEMAIVWLETPGE